MHMISTTAVRAQAMCLLARVGLITPAAREAAGRRVVAMRHEEEMMRRGGRSGWRHWLGLGGQGEATATHCCETTIDSYI